MFERVLIANRGEIACRVIRTCRRLGIHTIAVYSEADRDAQHVRLADEAWPIGGPRPAESYLRGDVILQVAKKSRAQAVHPGYGFLSENTDFARACTDAGIVFIGPKPESIDAMGSKAAAKALMEKHAVPLVPGYHGENQDADFLAAQAQKTGFPLMIKAAAGGGGKGMRIVRNAAEFADALASAQREATSAFGDARVILERYVEHPRHIEFQVFGDTHGHVIHLNERECSAQRRYQKVLEETPCPTLDEATRLAMGQAAVAAAKAVDYVGAGTVEFIVARKADGSPGEFFFMEMNTRLQVEHPITELVTGQDLVEWQLRIAAGAPLPLAQEDVVQRGHAMEVRLYAEDPDAGFLPGSGKLERLCLPAPSPHVRIDAGVVEGDTVTIFYDPMIAKLIVWDDDRSSALARMRDALAQCEVEGPKSNIGFLERLVRHPAVVGGTIDTGYLDRHLDEFLAPAEPDTDLLLAAATTRLLWREASARDQAAASTDPTSPWAILDGWRLGHAGKRELVFLHRGERVELIAHGSGGDYRIDHGGQTHVVSGARWQDKILRLRIGDGARRFRARADARRVLVHDGGMRLALAPQDAYLHAAGAQDAGDDRLRAPMPGRVVLVRVASGDTVSAGQELMVLEAMKMELSLKAPRDGEVAEVRAAAGEFVEADAVLVALSP
jgi:3-methylcrotonyl-CoA carboxylase alpha subunit